MISPERQQLKPAAGSLYITKRLPLKSKKFFPGEISSLPLIISARPIFPKEQRF